MVAAMVIENICVVFVLCLTFNCHNKTILASTPTNKCSYKKTRVEIISHRWALFPFFFFCSFARDEMFKMSWINSIANGCIPLRCDTFSLRSGLDFLWRLAGKRPRYISEWLHLWLCCQTDPISQSELQDVARNSSQKYINHWLSVVLRKVSTDSTNSFKEQCAIYVWLEWDHFICREYTSEAGLLIRRCFYISNVSALKCTFLPVDGAKSYWLDI